MRSLSQFGQGPFSLVLVCGLLLGAGVWIAVAYGPGPGAPVASEIPVRESPPRKAASGEAAAPGESAAPEASGAPPLLLTTGSPGGDRSRAAGTVVLATPGEPWAKGTNALWCATVEMVWREFGETILGEPIRLARANPMGERLSAAPRVSLAEKHRWTGAGPRTGEAIAAAKASLLEKFPESLSVPLIGVGPGYFAIAYLEAAFQFGHPYRDMAKPLRWGAEARPVLGFGIPRDARGSMREHRRQAAVLFARTEDHGGLKVLAEYAIDLDRTSRPFQIILAVVPRKVTLEATWAGVVRRMAARQASLSGAPRGLGAGDTLLVPQVNFDIEHTFPEVRGARLANAGFTDEALTLLYQRTTFRLDKAGVETKSIAVIITTRGGSEPRNYAFDRPFLIALRQRGAERPFLLLWVANPEWLARAKS